MRGKSLRLIALAALVAALGACAPATAPAPASPAPVPKAASPEAEDTEWAKVVVAAKKEGLVSVYANAWTGDIGIAVSKAFEGKHGIRLSLITGRGAEFLERIKTERRMGNVVADVEEGAPSHSENMKLAGLLAPTADLPVLRDKSIFALDPFFYAPQGHYLGKEQRFTGLHVNTNLVKPAEEPKAWVDLLDPKWKGKIAISDPEVSVSTYYFALLVHRGTLTPDFIENLGKQKLLFHPSATGVAAMLARGEAAIGLTTQIYTSRMVLEGAPIKIIDTKEGVFGSAGVVGRVEGGPHPNASKLLLNWILSKEGQDVHTKAMGVVSVRKDVPDYLPPAVQLRPENPVFETTEDNVLIAKLFREKRYVPLLKPKG